MGKYKHVKLDADALRRGGASAVLAVDPSVLGGTVKLLAEEPPSFESAACAVSGDGKSAARPPAVVGVVRIEGPLSQKAISDLCGYVDGYDAIAARFELTLENPETTAALLVIDSPGGDVAGLESAVARMQSAKKKHGKKVVAYLDEMAASAAYWIAACVADEIVLPVAGRAGSIGCIGAFVDMTAAAEQDGEKWHVARYPEGKADMFPLAPVTDLAMQRLQTSVESTGKRFVKAIADARGLGTSAVKSMNGCVFQGPAAVNARLADRVGTFEQALARTQKPTEKASIQKEKPMNLTSKIATALGLAAEASETDAIEAFAAFEKSLLATTKAPTVRAALAEVEKMAETNAAHKTAAETHAAAQLELEKLKAAAALSEQTKAVETVLAAGVAARKVTPAKREALLEKGMKNGAEWLQSVVDELPVLAGGEAPPPKPAATAAPELSEREAAMCAELGLDPKTYAADKSARKA